MGTPTFRVLASVAYQYLPAGAPPPARAEPVLDDDPDHDGVRGAADRCPNDPEDKDGFEDEDGCPDLDNDKDGIPDSKDKCPLEAEDKDGFEDDDGCPDLDNDKDGIPDTRDRCPLEAEDKDGFEDDDGCPDLDNDKDGIPDSKDKCPNEPEVYNGFEDEDGCPDLSKGPVQIQQGKVTTPPVFFATNKAVILKKSFRMLGQVFEALQANRWIKRVRIEGHTDSRGSDQKNLLLSRRRAESVRLFLLDLGIDADRLESEGFGKTRPIADNRTARGRAQNRRVDFVIVDPTPVGK
jgi:outer membrane protein OmpA-like peptidoglycan-associated protein